MASTTSSSPLPSGRAIFTKMPELLFIPEFVAGGLVWALLVDSRKLLNGLYSEDWVMFVSIFCFVVTTILFICSASGINQKVAYWPTLVMAFAAGLLYAVHTKFSASR
ncbi:hypothetical protein SKAU_G00181130 [Synaphobranchus kaupii]|uniref:Uncharacterized protein n=1 Tax=Synaphobranchus kaupii TaxID=118154 RepID=A0A9Q1FMM8_SYNKA|nr:hypothetical protein SKAU_G00181130 [Synaphobranchus kaupii]